MGNWMGLLSSQGEDTVTKPLEKQRAEEDGNYQVLGDSEYDAYGTLSSLNV